MRFLIISLLFVLLFFSCGIPTTKGFSEHNSSITNFSNPYFSNVKTDYVYKAKINAFNQVFGGMLIVKKIKENNHRVVFTTNFGNKIFDFELINDDVKTHFIIDDLNRKIIVNRLTKDFIILTREENKIIKTLIKNQQQSIYQSKIKNRYNHFIVTSKTKELTEIVHTTNSKEKIVITFKDIQNTIANHINIQHKNAPITIELTYINNND